MLDTGIATRLRSAGEEVVEIKGWKTRSNGNELFPKGGVNHHTAGHPSKTSPAPSLNICIFGRSDLPGPLCNALFGFDCKWYVVAAGAANHAGLPDVNPFNGWGTGNSAVYGVEVEHDGLHSLGDKRVQHLARGWAAILRKEDIPASRLVQHWEWAPSRKIDLATNMHPGNAPTQDAFRGMVAKQIKALDQVVVWKVNFATTEKKNGRWVRDVDRTRDKEQWIRQHPAAFQRSQVRFIPVLRG